MERGDNHENVFHRLYGQGDHPLRELYGNGDKDLWAIINKAEEAFSEVHDLIGDNRKKYRGVPSVTHAPGHSKMPLVGSLPQSKHSSEAANSVVLNDNISPVLSYEEECESEDAVSDQVSVNGKFAQASSVNSVERDNIQRFYKFVQQEQESDEKQLTIREKHGSSTNGTFKCLSCTSNYDTSSPHWIHIRRLSQMLRDLDLENTSSIVSKNTKLLPEEKADDKAQPNEIDLGEMVLNELYESIKTLTNKYISSLRNLENENSSLRLAIEALTMDLLIQRREQEKLAKFVADMDKRHKESMKECNEMLVHRQVQNESQAKLSPVSTACNDLQVNFPLSCDLEINRLDDDVNVRRILEQVKQLRYEEKQATERTLQLQTSRPHPSKHSDHL